jgi:hypothetical protein
MKFTLIASVLVFAVAASGHAQQPIGSTFPAAHYSRTQLSQLVRDAHTKGQYETLATYYQGKQTAFSEEASQKKQEWIRMSQNVVLTYGKYPRPVDWARYLYEYYADQAQRAGKLVTKYEQLADAATPTAPK